MNAEEIPKYEVQKTFDFASPPSLTENTEYVLVAWGQSASGSLYVYYFDGDVNQIHDQAVTYNSFPSPADFNHAHYKQSIYCSYTVGAVSKSVAGATAGQGSVLVNKKLSVGGSVVGSGSLLRGKKFVISGSGEGLGSVVAQEMVTEVNVQGSAEGLGSVLRGKKFTVLGSAEGQAWVIVDKGEVAVLVRVKLEDIFR